MSTRITITAVWSLKRTYFPEKPEPMASSGSIGGFPASSAAAGVKNSGDSIHIVRSTKCFFISGSMLVQMVSTLHQATIKSAQT